jgi:ribosome-binding factor A
MKNRNNDQQGPTQRQLRVGEVLRRALADVLRRGDLYDDELANVSVTVGEVRSSPDLKVAHIHVSPLGGQNAQAVVDALNRHKVELRRMVTRDVKLKFSPELRFVLDTTFDNMDLTTSLLNRDDVRRDLDKD